MQDSYTCKLRKSTKPTVLKAGKVHLTYDAVTVESFTIDSKGRKRFSGIKATIPTALKKVRFS